MESLIDDEAGWARVAELLAAGELVVVPTDTVFGVAAAVARPAAVARLFPMKARDVNKPVAVLVADLDQASEVVDIDDVSRRLLQQCWPGALTVVLPRAAGFTTDLGGAGDTVGVRCPDHERLRAVCRAVGPLATTSANRSGQPTPADPQDIGHQLAGTGIAALVDGGPLPHAASTVVRVHGGTLTVLREGPVSESDLLAALRAPAPDA